MKHMKTSNYILIALFAFVTVSLLVLFISARGHENVGRAFESIQKDYPLDSINVIVAEPEVLINIHPFDKNVLVINYLKGEEEPENLYRVSNDTLFVLEIVHSKEMRMRMDIGVYVNHLSSVVAKNKANVSIYDFTSDKLEIHANQAYVNIQNSSIEEAIIQADNSNVSMFSTNVNFVIAKLENESNLYGDSKSISKMDLERDQNSKINFY